jgi:hypothetical protein
MTSHFISAKGAIRTILIPFLIVFAVALNDVQGIHRNVRPRVIANVISASFVALCLDCSQAVLADVGTNDIRCSVVVNNPALIPAGTGSAIYLTARQDVGIWTAQIKNMKPPPILTSRTPSPYTFPLAITLSAANDITAEGLEIQQQWQSGKASIVVSARLDADGIAATRNAEDLVGKSIASKNENGEWVGCQIELTDRGFGGKMITKKK